MVISDVSKPQEFNATSDGQRVLVDYHCADCVLSLEKQGSVDRKEAHGALLLTSVSLLVQQLFKAGHGVTTAIITMLSAKKFAQGNIYKIAY